MNWEMTELVKMGDFDVEYTVDNYGIVCDYIASVYAVTCACV